MTSTPKKPKGSLYLCFNALLCTLLWGSAIPLIRLASAEYDSEQLSSHIAFAGIRFTLAGLMALVFIKKPLKALNNAPWGLLLTCTVFQIYLQYLLFYWGLKISPAVLVASLVSSGSFWWVILAPLVDKTQSIRPIQFIWLIIGALGVTLCLNHNGSMEGSLLGGLLIIGATLCGTIAALTVRPIHQRGISMPLLTGFALLVGGLLLCISAPRATYTIITQMNTKLACITFYLAFTSVAAFSLWYKLITLYDVTRMSAYRMFIPVFGVLISILILPEEHLSWQIFVGGSILLLSVAALEKSKRKQS